MFFNILEFYFQMIGGMMNCFFTITMLSSLAAVRFGRVPKKEKAKIYEQMQKVNLQSHNWQLCSTFSDEASLVACIVDTHRSTCKFTRENFRAFYQTVWQNPRFVDCPAHLVSFVATIIFLLPPYNRLMEPFKFF